MKDDEEVPAWEDLKFVRLAKWIEENHEPGDIVTIPIHKGPVQ